MVEEKRFFFQYSRRSGEQPQLPQLELWPAVVVQQGCVVHDNASAAEVNVRVRARGAAPLPVVEVCAVLAELRRDTDARVCE